MNPTVTVIIPTYNRPDLVGGAIKSVLNQTFKDFEIIVVDDGQEKRAEDVVNSFYDSRIRYIKHDENKGCSAAKNTGIKNASGEYICFLDDDDYWEREKLQLQVSALKGASEKAGFSFTGAIEIFDGRRGIKKVPEGESDYREFALRRFNGMLASTLMIKKSVFNNVGMLDETFPTHTDIELLLRITDKYNGVGINKHLVWRKMETGHTQMGSNIENRIRGRKMLLLKYSKDFEKYPTYLCKHLLMLSKFYREIEKYKKARKTVGEVLKTRFKVKYALHFLSLLFNGLGYRLFKKIKKIISKE